MSMPSRLGRLRQVSRLGAGGFASVWLYQDDVLDSLVAVKALADNWSQHLDVRERFLEEARILRRADSDHVVRVYDLGETADGTPYFVMSYADRGTVEDLLVEGRLPWPQVVDLVRQAGKGLSVLHRIGVLHRDIKPPNLLLQTSDGRQPRLMVADLGVAKALAQASGLTQLVGTAAYMAPEQAMPGIGIDVRADVHALGAVAYRMVTGRVMREGGLETMSNLQLPPPPSSLVPGLPPGFDGVMQRAISIDRDARWPDVDSFVAALDHVATGVATPAHWTPAQWPPDGVDGRETRLDPTPVPTSSAPVASAPAVWSRRRVVLAAALVLLLVMVGVVAWRRAGVPDADGTRVSSTPHNSKLAVDLPGAWAQTVRTSDRVDYRRALHGSELGLLVRMRRIGLAESPRRVAAKELDRVSVAAGFDLVSSRALTRSQLGDWQWGWAIRYGYVLDGERRQQQEWFVGDVNRTAGSVSAAGPVGQLQAAFSLLPTALAALPRQTAPPQ